MPLKFCCNWVKLNKKSTKKLAAWLPARSSYDAQGSLHVKALLYIACKEKELDKIKQKCESEVKFLANNFQIGKSVTCQWSIEYCLQFRLSRLIVMLSQPCRYSHSSHISFD